MFIGSFEFGQSFMQDGRNVVIVLASFLVWLESLYRTGTHSVMFQSQGEFAQVNSVSLVLRGKNWTFVS